MEASNAVFLMGLPPNITETVLRDFVPDSIRSEVVTITIKPPNPQKPEYCSATIIFTSGYVASQFIDERNRTRIPGDLNKITIKRTTVHSNAPELPYSRGRGAATRGRGSQRTSTSTEFAPRGGATNRISTGSERGGYSRGRGAPTRGAEPYRPSSGYSPSAGIRGGAPQRFVAAEGSYSRGRGAANTGLPLRTSPGFIPRGESVSVWPPVGFKLDPFSVHIAGLPETVTEESLLSFFQERTGKIATFPNGGFRVIVLKKDNAKSFGKITYETENEAADCIEKMNGEKFCGLRKMKVKRFQEKVKEVKPLSDPIVAPDKQFEVPATIVRNVVYYRGIPKKVTKDEIVVYFGFIGKVTEAQLYHQDDGKSQGRGTVSFENQLAAARCIEGMNGKIFPGNKETAMRLCLFKSRKIRRVPGAIGTDHLFTGGSEAYAYECPGCLDTFDERDMVGCVPVGHLQTDSETHFICQECAIAHSESVAVSGTLGSYGTGLPCSGGNDCKRIIQRATIERWLTVLKKTDVQKNLEQRMNEAALRDVTLGNGEVIERCKSCSYGVIIPFTKDQMQYFQCEAPSCRAQFCRKCDIDYAQHKDKSCEDVDPERLEIRARTAGEEAKSKAVIRYCPSCKTAHNKNGGCNKYTCSQCSTAFCYLCGTIVKDYSHFSAAGCGLHEDVAEYDRKRVNQAVPQQA